MTRVGLAGVGVWGTKWLREVRPELVLRNKFWNKSGTDVTPTTTDLSHFLEASTTHVIVATPTETHFDIVSAALEAGKHVLCEKPLAETADQVRELMRLAEKHDRRLWVSYPHLWHPALEEARCGEARDFTCCFVGPTPRAPLLDWGPHALSTGLWLLGGDAVVEEVLSSSARRISSDTGSKLVGLSSSSGTVSCTFGWAREKFTSLHSFPGHFFPETAEGVLRYSGEPAEPSTLRRMFDAWVSGEDDDRGDLHLTLRVHEILDEVMKT